MKISLAFVMGAWIASVSAADMPVAQQNALIQKYCAVCHTDARPNGGLTLQHFDAAHADPGDAAMVLSKVLDGALGAAGLPAPDEPTVDAWKSALKTQAVGSDQWTVKRANDGVIVSIVREVPNAKQPDLFRLTLTCRGGQAGMQLAWAPGVPKSGQEFSVTVDDGPQAHYTAAGSETMGNGSGGTSGPGFILLRGSPLPTRSLTVRDAFPGETVVFPFAELPPAARNSLAACFR